MEHYPYGLQLIVTVKDKSRSIYIARQQIKYGQLLRLLRRATAASDSAPLRICQGKRGNRDIASVYRRGISAALNACILYLCQLGLKPCCGAKFPKIPPFCS